MSEYTFKVDLDRLSYEEFVELQSGLAAKEERTPQETFEYNKSLLKRFITNGDGAYLPDKEADKVVGSMGLGSVLKAIAEFSGLIQSIVPPAIGDGSPPA